MKENGGTSRRKGAVLVLDRHDLVSVSEQRIVVRCSRQLKVNGLYRVKSLKKLPDFDVSARVGSCSLRISRDEEGHQIPVYEAVLELYSGEGSD